MSLKFPNARLLIYDLLNSGGLTGPQAIVQGAVDFGLINKKTADEINKQNGSSGCHCVSMTKEVLVKYCAQKNSENNAPTIDSQKMWSGLTADLKAYRQSIKGAPTHCSETHNDGCLMFAPALFDLLLQQVNRYS